MCSRVLLAVALAMSIAVPTRAQDAVRLEHRDEIPEAACPAEAELREIVIARVGFDPFAADATTTVRITARAHGDDDVELLVELLGADGLAHGERSFVGRASHCRELAENAALVVALAVDPLGVGARAVPPESDDVSVADEPSHADAATPTDTSDAADATVVSAPDSDPAIEPIADPTTEPAASTLHLSIAATFDARFLRAPLPMLGGTFAVGLRGEHWSAFAAASSSATPVDADTAGGARLHTEVYGGAVGGCGHYDIVFACLSAFVGAYETRATGVARPGTLSSVYAEIALSPGIEWWLAPWIGLRAAVDVAVPLVRVEVTMDGASLVSMPAISLGAGLGLVGRIGL